MRHRPWCICGTASTSDVRLRKRIIRTLIQEVVADIDGEAGEVILVLHWTGGVHMELRLPRRRRGQRNSTSKSTVEAVRLPVRIVDDDQIAGILNRNGLTTGHGNRWTRERVTALRRRGAWIGGVGATTPTPSGVRRCGRSSGAPIPACG